MTTISSARAPFADLPRTQGPASAAKQVYVIDTSKTAELSSADKAERAKANAEKDAAKAASDKRLKEIEQHKNVENNGIYTSNVSSLSLENAKKNLGFAQLMIERKEGVGSTFHGHYGDQELTNLNQWEAALKDYIGKQEAAAAMYGKVQEMS